MTLLTATTVQSTIRPIQWPAVIVALSALGAGGLLLMPFGWRHAALFLVGAMLGATLYHGSFGFTAAYRNMILHRDVSGPLAQIAMLGLATALFAPFLAHGDAFGHAVVGALAPAGLSVATGSFLFGVGMQLGNGCASGTLYTVGGGSPRMLVVLAAFCAGSFIASFDMGFWQQLPSLGVVSLGKRLGWPGAVALELAVLTLIALWLRRWGDRPARRLSLASVTWRQLVQGPWPIFLSAALLSLLNCGTLLLAGHPWTITWAFTIWGAKGAAALGWNSASSAFWAGDFQTEALHASLFADVTSVMDIGIMLGAFLAAALGGRFAPTLRIGPYSLLAAVIGGLLMGYGARIAYGCNIGAFVSGVASTSLHGWIWILCALPGNWVGVRLRPLFGLRN